MAADRPTLRWRTALWIAFGALIGLLGPSVIPAATGAAGPAQVSLQVGVGAGGTRLALTPLGTIAAATHRAPVQVELSLVEVDIETLARSATSPTGRAALRGAVSEDLRSLALKGALQFALGLILIAAATSALTFGRHLLPVVTAVASALVVFGAVMGITVATFDVSAFEEPSFSGPLTKARQVIDVVTESGEVLDEARSRFDIATERLSDLFVLLAESDSDPLASGTVLLHVSDIHGNPIGFDIAKQLSDQFGVDAVVDTGDLAVSFLDTGPLSTAIDPIDSAIARAIGDLELPYVYVAGNHDSPQLKRRIAELPNVRILDESTTEIESLEIYGWGDPTFKTFPMPEEEKSALRLEQAPDIAAGVELEDPDILLVHDSVMASESFGEVPLVLSGHTHERSEVFEEGTRVLTVGSAGATGLKSLTVESDRPYEAQILYFEDAQLVAVDYVSFTELGGDFELSRRTYMEPDSERASRDRRS